MVEEGRFILKYFLVDRPRRKALRPRVLHDRQGSCEPPFGIGFPNLIYFRRYFALRGRLERQRASEKKLQALLRRLTEPD